MTAIHLAKGFSLATTSAGFRKAGKPDLALVLSHTPAVAAGVFTTNLFKAAPVLVGHAMLKASPFARGVVINTGQANACTGEEGIANCHKTQQLIAQATGLEANEILPASTGVIGAQLKMDTWEQAVPALVSGLGKSGLEDFATAIMTTDRFPKYATEQVTCGKNTVTLSGVAKGAGMICPNMATMLCVVLCDAQVNPALWQTLVSRAVNTSFNRATVDGDTSTNDTVYALANGASGCTPTGEDIISLEAALTRVLTALAYKLVEDGEGATKVINITVRGAKTTADAEQAARTVGHSPLVKTAMYGKDANWGRIVAALGRSGVCFDPAQVSVRLCGVLLFENEQPTDCDFDTLLQIPLAGKDIHIDINLGTGKGEYSLLASDLTHTYIDINASYRS